jgi:hypothetical protein
MSKNRYFTGNPPSEDYLGISQGIPTWQKGGFIRALFLRLSGQKGFIQRLSREWAENKKPLFSRLFKWLLV